MQAGSLFYFMFADGARMPLQPPLQLDSDDLYRLRRFTACVALRHQCATLLHSAATPAKQPALPTPSVVVVGKGGKGLLGAGGPGAANPLAASMSKQPPLRTRPA